MVPEKTQRIEFGPLAQIRARRLGGKAQTFDALGFTHYCTRTRHGRGFRMKRKTISKRLTAKLKSYKESLKKNAQARLVLLGGTGLLDEPCI